MITDSAMIGVDVGGTFTDVVGIADGRLTVTKVPTEVGSSDTSVVAGAAEIGLEGVMSLNLASTAGLNAVITRRIPKVGFITTEGHRDMLDRGRLGRPMRALTDMSWRRGTGDTQRPMVPRYLRRGVRERITATGQVLIALDEDQARLELGVLARCHIDVLAVCLLNAYVDDRHELRIRELAAEVLGPAVPCSISSEVSPLAREYARASTTVVDAVMKATYGAYTDRLEAGLAAHGFRGQLNYADCSARLLPADRAMRRPHRLVVGGPAAGTASAAHLGALIGDGNLLCADVGGTSCDISVVLDGKPWVAALFEVEHDLVVTALSTDVVTLGAGGGSIVSISTAGDIQVGPDSVGADPGPACYGRGGRHPTLTDAALLMGILDGEQFLGGRLPLRADLAEEAFRSLPSALTLGQRIDYAWRTGLANVAEGVLDVTVRRGIDPRDLSLVAFGAAGPMLLPGLLDLIPLKRVVIPPHPGIFSALGLVSTDQVHSDQRSAYTVLSTETADAVEAIFTEMEDGLLEQTGMRRGDARLVRSFDGRLLGQSWETPFVEIDGAAISATSVEDMIGRFHDAYEVRNGSRFAAMPVQAVTFRVQLVVPTAKVTYQKVAKGDGAAPSPTRVLRLRHVNGRELDVPELERSALASGASIRGPAIIREPVSTTVVPEGRTLSVGELGELIIR